MTEIENCNFLSDNEKNLSIESEKKLYTLPSSKAVSLQDYQKAQVSLALKKSWNTNQIVSIIDATCHIGGDSINFAHIFPNAHITCIDSDINAIHALTLNIHNSGMSERFTIYHGDCIEYLCNLKEPVDIIYFDPPWGGYSYAHEAKFNLTLASGMMKKSYCISSIVNWCFSKNLATFVLLKAPRNFDIETFANNVACSSYRYDIYKMNNTIAYMLILCFFE